MVCIGLLSIDMFIRGQFGDDFFKRAEVGNSTLCLF